MSQAENNGAPRRPKVPEPIILADGSRFFPDREDDPDVIEDSWPNGDGPPSYAAFPPKKDDVRSETLTEELMALVNAMTGYKRKRGLQYLLWNDVLDVLHDMGYRKVAAPADAPAQPVPAGGTVNP